MDIKMTTQLWLILTDFPDFRAGLYWCAVFWELDENLLLECGMNMPFLPSHKKVNDFLLFFSTPFSEWFTN